MIDTVFLTHAHPDHIGGVVDAQGALNFPNAQFYVAKEEWDFWFTDKAIALGFERHIAPARKGLSAVKDRVTLLEGSTKIFKGITSLPAPGHTPGHTVYSFREKLYYTGDTVLHSLHLEHPDWLPVYDIMPDKAEASKRAIFNLLADKKALVVPQQFFPSPSVGHVKKNESAWIWTPEEV